MLDWPSILNNTTPAYDAEISGLVWIFMISFCMTFVLNLIKPIAAADQRPAIASFIDMLGQLLTLGGIFILAKTTSPSLIYLGLVSGFAPVVVYLVANIHLFSTRYRMWKPSFRFVNFRLAGNMMNLGIKFFIASIAVVMVNQTLSFLILRTSDSVEVTNYNTSFRLFSIAFNTMGIILIPYWSSFTDAFAKKDFEWMKHSVSRLLSVFYIFVIVQILFLVLSPFIYYLFVNHWIHDDKNLLAIPFFMSVAVCLYTIATGWMSVFMHPLNGIGKIKLQTYSSIGEMILLIPVALGLSRIFGAPGIILAPVVVYIPRMVWAPVQLHKLIHNKALGIWGE
jgi:O-antigen/teichoic acid export membrane protein